MNKILIGALALSLIGAQASMAQPYGDHGDRGGHAGWGQDRGAGHSWARGERMGYNDWNGAGRVNYREHHLRRPPSGYEWRESNGQYVLAAIATGVIASIIINSGR
jgi:Ni/Co efflux regulator RcnB